MSKTIHPTVKPEVVHLEDLFRAIDQGTLRIPDFQRPFVWNEADMRKLFDSILMGYPIGSLLIWEPNEKVEIRSAKKVGPFEVHKSETNPSFVIDGYQRLSTLYGVLKSGRIKEEKEEYHKYNIFLNIQKDGHELEHINLVTGRKPHLIPLHSLWTSRGFFEVSDKIRQENIDPSGEILHRLEDIYSNLRGYKMAVVRMVGGDIQDAINIFTRLNSTGKKVSEVQMLNALTNTNLESQFDLIKETLKEWHFDEIEDRLLLRAHYMATETDIYKMSPTAYVKLTESNLDRNYYSDVTKTGLSEAAKFLWEECSVPGIQWLPYALQFLLFGEFFRKCPSPNIQQREKLKRWFWQTSYQSWFASANSTKVKLALEEIRKLAADTNHEIEGVDTRDRTVPFPLVQKTNSARVSTFYLFYLSLQPRIIKHGASPTGVMTRELMATGPKNVLNPIFTSTKPRNQIANLVLCESETPGIINANFQNDPLLALSHGVTQSALLCLKNNDHVGFLQKRQAELMRLESEFIKSWGLVPSDQKPKETNEDSEIE
jgi:hypothetical protein